MQQKLMGICKSPFIDQIVFWPVDTQENITNYGQPILICLFWSF